MNRAVIVLFGAIGKGLGIFASSASAEGVAAFVNAAGVALAEVSAGFLEMHNRERAEDREREDRDREWRRTEAGREVTRLAADVEELRMEVVSMAEGMKAARAVSP